MLKGQRLLVQFLEQELELTRTMIDLMRIELKHTNNTHAGKSRANVQHGFDAISKFIGRVALREDRARIADGLERLQNEVEGLVPIDPDQPCGQFRCLRRN